MQPSLSISQYLLGILVAVAIFIINDAISHARNGYRFRRRLVTDIRVIVDNFYQHLSSLTTEIEKLGNLYDAFKANQSPEVKAPPFWSNSFNLLNDLYQNSHHLKLRSFHEAVRFYDTVGRLDEVRKAYNESVRQLYAGTEQKSLAIKYLYLRTRDMHNQYRELINRGCKALEVISKEHRFLNVDLAYCGNILTEVSKKELPKS